MSIKRFVVVFAAVAGLGLGAATQWSLAQDEQEGEGQEQQEQQQEQKEEKPAAKVQPVDYRKLREIAPASIAGIERTDLEGEKVSMGEFALSTARADYSPESDAEEPPYAHLEILDWGSNPDMAAAQAAWTQMEIDREGDDGFQRTVKIQGKYPAMLSYDNEGKHGEAQIYVAERFIVSLTTDNVSAEQFTKAAEELPLDKLAALK